MGIDASLKALKKYLAIKIPATKRINDPKRGKTGHIRGPKEWTLQPKEECNGQKGKKK